MGSFWMNLKFLFRGFFVRRPGASTSGPGKSEGRVEEEGTEDRMISALPSGGTPKAGRRTRDLS